MLGSAILLEDPACSYRTKPRNELDNDEVKTKAKAKAKAKAEAGALWCTASQ